MESVTEIECENCEFCWINHRPEKLQMQKYNNKLYCTTCYDQEKTKDSEAVFVEDVDKMLSVQKLSDTNNWNKITRCEVKNNCFYCTEIDKLDYPLEYAQMIEKYGLILYVYKFCSIIILCDYCFNYRNVLDSVLQFMSKRFIA